MDKVILLEELVKFTEQVTADLIMPVQQQKNEEPMPRPAMV